MSLPALTLVELAAELGACRQIEERLALHLGVVATGEIDDGRAVRVGVASHHHAWHLDIIDQRLPAIPGFEVAPCAVDEPTSDALQSLATLDAGASLTVVYTTIVPRLIVRYEAVLSRTSRRTDPHTVRIVEFIVADLMDDIAALGG